MKKLVFVLLAVLTIASCQKKETQPTTPAKQDVTFSVTEVIPDLKSTDDWECKADVPTHARVIINDVNYYPELFELDGQLYTQAIKLPVDVTYCIEDFILYKEMGGEGYDKDVDEVVFGTPHTGSEYAVYVDQPVGDNCENSFTVNAFTKAELNIQVLCFQDADYQKFGFDWFAITEIVIRQFCFFGDICITNDMYGAFDNSIYDLNGGLDPDEEAVFRVIVKDGTEEVPYSPFSNEANYGTGEALCVDYPDNLSEINDFTFELQVWVPSTVPGTFVWQTYATFTSTDAGNLFYNTEDLGDNTTVKSFAVGDCSPDSNPVFTWLDPIDPEEAEPTLCFFQGFEDNLDGWVNSGYGLETREISGTDGIAAAAGNYFAYFSNDPSQQTGPFTYFCGKTCDWAPWTAEVDVYLDPTGWGPAQGFDFSIAASTKADGQGECVHLRDFIFHVATQANGDLLVAGSNNTNFGIRQDLASLNNYEVTTTGWYTLQAVFYDDGSGLLTCDLNLLDMSNTVLFTETRQSAADVIATEVGGHRYGWFTVIDVANGLAVDNTELFD